MIEKIFGQIPKKELITDKWYLGRGRNSNIGYWDGELFIVLARTFDMWKIKKEGYYELGEDGTGCFQPFVLIDEGETINPFSTHPILANYNGERLKLKIGYPELNACKSDD